MPSRLKHRALVLAALAWPGAAFAHPGHGDASGFVHGFAHPLTGLDHVAAMVSVGILAALMGGRALWRLPLTFLAAMALGGFAGMEGFSLPLLEVGIAVSAIALAGLAVLRVGLPPAVAAPLVAVAAVLHGLAHGAEMPLGAGAAAYAGGFLLATALLHVAGLALGLLLTKRATRQVTRHAG